MSRPPTQSEATLLPGGRIVCHGSDPECPLRTAFLQSNASGLIILATDALEELLPPSLAFWRTFARDYFVRLSQSPRLGALSEWERVPPPPVGELADLIVRAPPSPGMEYLNTDLLHRLWQEMDALAAESAALEGGLEGWLKKRNPLWNLVGRVTFHLAENRRNEQFPFAFLATYTHRISNRSQLQYLPLGKALVAYVGKKNTRALKSLLAPVQRAAETSDFARELLESKRVFHALAWSPAEAHRFIRAIPDLEAAGLLVRVPDWWKNGRPARPMVNVTMDTSRRTSVGIGALLSFRVELALDGQVLGRQEWETLLASAGNLVSIKGKWVEVDRDKLQQVLAHWQRAESAAASGALTFLQGMRMLAGFHPGGGGVLEGLEEALEGGGDWTQINAGGKLKALLDDIRDPSSRGKADPGGQLRAELRHYQQDGLNWLYLMHRLGLGACLADDMGLGKTLQVIALLLMIRKGESGMPNMPSLLIVPASLIGNWMSEFAKFAPSLDVFVAHASHTPRQKLAKFAAEISGRDAVITTYSMLDRLDGLKERQWNLVVLDEAQAIKNPRSSQTRSVKSLQSRQRLALTGTPIENSVADLWSIFDFLNPGLLGTASRFSEAANRLAGNGARGYAPLRKLISPFILRRLKTDRSVISDLPDKTEIRTNCPLTRGQASMYQRSVDQLSEELKETGAGGIERSGLVLSYLIRLKQICNHPGLWTGSGNFPENDSGKFKRLRELCEEIRARGEKVLVFTQFREMTSPLGDFLETIFARPGLVLHGGTSVRQRQNLVADFQSDTGPPFFVISLKAGGTGLNLTAASHVIHFDRWWNPAVENQATDRAFRIGQKRNVLVHKFICPGTIEARIDHLLEEKKTLADDILGPGTEKLLTSVSDEELLRMVTLDLDAAVF